MGKMREEMDREVPLETKVDDLYRLIADIDIAMLTTRRPDGMLVTRPMGTQQQQPVADFWFVTDAGTEKVDELTADPHVSLAYLNAKTSEWVSVSGTVRVSRDRETIRKLYSDSWKLWFPDEGGDRDGGPDDPRFALLLVDAVSVVYGKRNKSRPHALIEIARTRVTREMPDLQDIRHVSGGDLP